MRAKKTGVQEPGNFSTSRNMAKDVYTVATLRAVSGDMMPIWVGTYARYTAGIQTNAIKNNVTRGLINQLAALSKCFAIDCLVGQKKDIGR